MAVVVSAPGKVLITGAYLILEKPNPGLVLTTTARFYAIVKPLRTSIDSSSWAWLWTDVKLTSPQLSKEAIYKLSLKTLSLQNVASSSSNGNPFVEQAVQFAVAAAKEAFVDNHDKQDMLHKLLLQGLEITIFGSNDFYSYRKQVSRESKSFLQAMSEIKSITWDNERIEYALPPYMSLILGEPGYGGSCTPSMVGAVQSWRKKDPQNSQVIWKKLAEANAAVERELLLLKNISQEQEQIYQNVLENCSRILAEKWMDNEKYGSSEQTVVKALLGARQALLEVRSTLRRIGEAAGVPIEPEPQTRILDITMNMEGVLLAGVPGAGGFDALFAITLGSSARDRVAHAWSTNGVLPLLVAEDPKGVTLEDGDPREKEIASGIHSIKLE